MLYFEEDSTFLSDPGTAAEILSPPETAAEIAKDHYPESEISCYN